MPANGLAHLVFFTLKDPSPTGRDRFIESCRRLLADHAGAIHFSVGPRAEAYVRPVNDQEFDVALVLVFASEADHDAYQASPRHQQFIAEQSPHWTAVRVFDAVV
ncbi:MAG TPA: Dabb family protein [Lacipirellulaceae bacterium]|nr:Dabb family protein [Lacipirellulaceae bacterium]